MVPQGLAPGHKGHEAVVVFVAGVGSRLPAFGLPPSDTCCLGRLGLVLSVILRSSTCRAKVCVVLAYPICGARSEWANAQARRGCWRQLCGGERQRVLPAHGFAGGSGGSVQREGGIGSPIQLLTLREDGVARRRAVLDRCHKREASVCLS